MKLYIIQNISNNDIIAISEYKFHIYSFYIQNNYNINKYKIFTITDDKKINNYLILFHDYYLIEYYDFIIRTKDKIIFDNYLYSNELKLYETENYLSYISDNTDIPKKERDILLKASKILSKNRRKNLSNFINLDKMIKDVYSIKGLRQSFHEMIENYNYQLDKD